MPTNSRAATEWRRASTPRLVFFGGKGGAGKTTCAAGRAVAEARRGRRVLALSTDPAHSLGATHGVRLSSRVSRIKGRGLRGELSAVELDGPRAFARWLRENRQALGDVIEHGTWLERGDIDALLELSIPGVDELMALVEIARVTSTVRPAFDLIVVDTAPTGHTLRLLAAPATVAAVAGVLEDLQEEHRLIRERFGRIGRPEAADRLIETMARQAREAGALLQDRSQSAFYLVTLPEELSIAETIDAIAALDRASIGLAGVVVNRVIPQGAPGPLCDPRRAADARLVARVHRLAGRRSVTTVEAKAGEPRGMRALAEIGDELTRTKAIARSAAASHRGGRFVGSRRPEPLTAHAPVRPETIAAFQNARLLLFGGKGGVGKTTCSAAVAIRLADASPSRRVLLLSTDPAHSLGDVLNATLGDKETRVAGAPANLRVREVDARRALAVRRADIEAALAEIASTAGTGIATSDAGKIVDLAPPGIDELLGMLSVVESLGLDERSPHSPPAYDLVVVDTAPTGHALRLLEVPDAARAWVQTLMRVLLKYRDLARPGQLARELVRLSQAIRRLQELLRDPNQTRFIAVTRAADVPALETRRLLLRVRALALSVPALIVNAVTFPPGQCSWCRKIAASEQEVLARLRRTQPRRPRSCAIIQTPLVAPPPRGARTLRTWAGQWRPA